TGKLIEECGLKGIESGGAKVSEKHCGFIVNTGGATAADVISLINYVQERVLSQTGIQIIPEVKIIGEA
ncbi:MAG: UDP-N-acetylenolpyruvoylglucosamine reductase, partial [Eubacteriales bacterium]|nr:UDP-N-acetylenolpyruvoylglucosamine reductase [Eubacteriales bacterium]